MKKLLAFALAVMLAPALISNASAADEVFITKGKMSIMVGDVKVMRNQDQNATINPAFAKTSRKCPPFCIQPQQVAPGVATIGELEMVNFMEAGGMVIDARTVEWHVRGTIPGSVNIPFTQVSTRLNEMGCTKTGDKWNCAGAKQVALFCNGLWCGQSPTAIRAMLRDGFPADKILYYRNGMQGWESVGLTVVEGEL